MSDKPKQYLIAGILVEATKSAGGSFYEITVVPTGEKLRYIADVFETVAKPVITEFVNGEHENHIPLMEEKNDSTVD